MNSKNLGGTQRGRTFTMVITAMMMCLIMVLTFSIRIPVPATNGYIHLGDTMIFVSVVILGRNYGALAAGVGSAMADLLAGYSQYIPITLVVKALMAFVVGSFISFALKKGFSGFGFRAMEVLAMVLGGIVMCGGYYIGEVFMYGWFTPLAAIPMNAVQFATGVILASAVVTVLYKTPVNKIIEMKLPS